MLAGYLIGALMAINGEISVGTYLAYAGMLVWIIFPIRNLGRLIVQTSTGLVSLGRLIEIIREDREPLDEGDYQPETINGEIEFVIVLRVRSRARCAAISASSAWGRWWPCWAEPAREDSLVNLLRASLNTRKATSCWTGSA